MISKGENELLCRTGPGTPMGAMVSFWVSQHTYEPEAPSVIAAKSGPWVRTDFLACSTLSPRWNCSSRPDLLDSPFPCDICACVTSLPPSLRRLPVRCEAKPEERESFLEGGKCTEECRASCSGDVSPGCAGLFCFLANRGGAEGAENETVERNSANSVPLW